MFAATPLFGRLATLDGSLAVVGQVAFAALVFVHVPTVEDPVETQRCEPFFRVACRAFRVVIVERRVRADAGRVREFDFGVRHVKIVAAGFVFEMDALGFTDVCFVALRAATCSDVHALLFGEPCGFLGGFRVGECAGLRVSGKVE